MSSVFPYENTISLISPRNLALLFLRFYFSNMILSTTSKILVNRSLPWYIEPAALEAKSEVILTPESLYLLDMNYKVFMQLLAS